MRVITAADIAQAITHRSMIEALRDAFRSQFVTPLRHHHTVERPDRPNSDLLLMPCWTDFKAQGHSDRGYQGVKLVAVTPDNAERDKPSIMGVYVLFSGVTGEPLAMIDGQALTLWRTADASALASSYLSRSDSSRLLMVGAGALAPFLIRAHAAVRPITEVLVWNRTLESAERVAKSVAEHGMSVSATEDLAEAAKGADIISCATLAQDSVLKGEWLQPGTHVDLVGAYRPTMREADDTCIRRARVFVDTRDGALNEAGDIIQAIDSGAMTAADISGDLFQLSRGEQPGRIQYNQITLFKSTGTALEDLAGAVHILTRA
jgi:ornithine cyclodeaminase/alanine dehydrogenase-like protein (mu-crystallin family)